MALIFAIANRFASSRFFSLDRMSLSYLFCFTLDGTSLALYSTDSALSYSLSFSITIFSTFFCLIEKPFSLFRNSKGTGTVTLYFPFPVFGTMFCFMTSFYLSALLSLYYLVSKLSSRSSPSSFSSPDPNGLELFLGFLLSSSLIFSLSLRRPLLVK